MNCSEQVVVTEACVMYSSPSTHYIWTEFVTTGVTEVMSAFSEIQFNHAGKMSVLLKKTLYKVVKSIDTKLLL